MKLRMQQLSKIFPEDTTSEGLSARMARLCVLYEDLRIELTAVAQKSIPLLEATDKRYRQNYFLRRSIATLVEFAEGLRLLNKTPGFATIRNAFPTEVTERWNMGVSFFAKNEKFFLRIRNDIGGHFGEEAARFAVSNLDPEAVGKMEVRGRTIHLHFAGELAATAATRHLLGSNSEQKFKVLLTRCVAGYKQATTCVHCLAVIHLWPKFGR